MGTHGSGRDTATVGDLVLALEVIDGHGELRTLSEETVGPEIMAAARLGLGMFGVIARIKLRIERAHRVLQIDRRLPIAEGFAELEHLVRTKDSVELFWFPINDWVWLRTFERTDAPSTFSGHGLGFMTQNFLHMLAASVHAKVVARVPALIPLLMRFLPLGISFRTRVLPRTAAVHYRRWLELCRYSCLEIGFKVDDRFENVRASFEDARRLVAEYAEQGRYPLDLVLNYRFIGPSKALLSPAYGPGLSCYPDALTYEETFDDPLAEVVAVCVGAELADGSAWVPDTVSLVTNQQPSSKNGGEAARATLDRKTAFHRALIEAQNQQAAYKNRLLRRK